MTIHKKRMILDEYGASTAFLAALCRPFDLVAVYYVVDLIASGRLQCTSSYILHSNERC
jgi:hypothetical protein